MVFKNFIEYNLYACRPAAQAAGYTYEGRLRGLKSKTLTDTLYHLLT
jgi:hypothetical protein